MKSEKAKEFIDESMTHLVCEMSDHAKWQLRASMTHAAVLAEQEAEERVRTKAHRIVKEMMSGIFHGDMPRKIADEFIQKMNDDDK